MYFFGISESKKSMLSIIILSLWSCAFFIQIAVDMQLYAILTVLFSFSFFLGGGGVAVCWHVLHAAELACQTI